MIVSGAKKTEYRDMSEYWVNKILDMSKYNGKTAQEVISDLYAGKVKLYTKPYTTIVFHCDKQVERYRIREINTYRGHKMFAIQLGKRA